MMNPLQKENDDLIKDKEIPKQEKS